MDRTPPLDEARPPSEDPPAARLRSLDVLRGIAVLLVIGRHLPLPPPDRGLLSTAFGVLNRGGWCGVDLFFVLSGFLVTGLVLREHATEGTFRPLRFLARRGFKIYPAFYVFLAVGLGLAPVFGLPPEALSPGRVAAEAFFLRSYLPGLFGHTWSLAIEEHFYFGLALVMAALVRRGGRAPFTALLPLAAVVCAACLAQRLYLSTRADAQLYTTMFPTHLRVDALMCGVALAFVRHTHRDALARFVARAWSLTPIGVILVSPAFLVELEDWRMQSFGLTTVYLGFAALLLVALHAPPGRALPWRALAWIGERSYSVYLWHTIALALTGLAAEAVAAPWWATVLLQVAASLALGALGAALVERPALALRERWVATGPPRPRATTTAA